MSSNARSKLVLGDIARIRRGASPRPIQDFIQSTPGVPWVKIADATASPGRFLNKTKEYVKQDGADRSVKVLKGTLILSNSATPGIPKIMGIDACVHDGWLILDELKNIEQDYLYYFLLNKREQLAKQATGSVFNNLKTVTVKNFEINLPPLNSQREAADILLSIDKKIELNRKINEMLEQIGKTLFKKHFIDNPEREKWDKGVLSDIAEITTGKGSVKSQESTDGTIPLYGANGVMGTSKEFLYEEKLIITGRVGTLGKVKIINEKAWFSDNVLIIRPNVRYFNYCYYYLTQIDFQSMNRGSTQPLITQTDLRNLKIELPESKTLVQFEETVSVLFNRVFMNEKEIFNLSTQKDILLPKLISGQVTF